MTEMAEALASTSPETPLQQMIARPWAMPSCPDRPEQTTHEEFTQSVPRWISLRKPLGRYVLCQSDPPSHRKVKKARRRLPTTSQGVDYARRLTLPTTLDERTHFSVTCHGAAVGGEEPLRAFLGLP